MKTKHGFRLRSICGENIIVAEGIENIDFSRIISMNESSAYLWQKVAETEFDEDTLTHLLVEEYEVSDEQARADVKQLMQKWLEAGIVEA
jgi:hypothetical protein